MRRAGFEAFLIDAGGDLVASEEPPEGGPWRIGIEDPAGGTLGVVALLEESPAGPQLTLQTPGGKEALVPFVRPMVMEIDRERKRVVLDLPEGLLDL